jgi:hypothetical protein
MFIAEPANLRMLATVSEFNVQEPHYRLQEMYALDKPVINMCYHCTLVQSDFEHSTHQAVALIFKDLNFSFVEELLLFQCLTWICRRNPGFVDVCRMYFLVTALSKCPVERKLMYKLKDWLTEGKYLKQLAEMILHSQIDESISAVFT